MGGERIISQASPHNHSEEISMKLETFRCLEVVASDLDRGILVSVKQNDLQKRFRDICNRGV
jgi:hypothetical protein